MFWTEERIEDLRRLWAQGLSASQIAKRLGSGVSRNAVIGKAHRLGLASRPSPIQGEARARAAVAVAPRPAMAPAPQPAKPLPAPAPAATSAIRHKGPACQWPIGDPSSQEFAFCGEPSEPGRPYCAKHCGVAYLRKDKAA
jgi:GcrA cell cycle regulator